MFTGIVRAVGRIAGIHDGGGSRRVAIRDADLPWQTCSVGDSIAVNGVCLTAVAVVADGFDTDLSPETLAVTTLGQLATGAAVNLEPALALGERLGGHLVSGHVDGIGTVRSRQSDGDAVRFSIDVPDEYSRFVARKGSITVDGVSLTVNAVSGRRIELTIIPHTLGATIMHDYRAGTEVNIEVDLLARYLERLLGRDGDITEEFLKAHGYG